MSNTLRTYELGVNNEGDQKEMTITATYQGEYAPSIGFKIGRNYIILSGNQLIDLYNVIGKRLNYNDGFCSTDWSNHKYIKPEKNIKFAKLVNHEKYIKQIKKGKYKIKKVILEKTK